VYSTLPKIAPTRLTLCKRAFDSPDWLFDDGFRALSYVSGGECRLVSECTPAVCAPIVSANCAQDLEGIVAKKKKRWWLKVENSAYSQGHDRKDFFKPGSK
jgi:hypothetical protein